ncbi:MAG TPA: hypothetical protein PKA62_11085 [Thermoanaerobaculia bacterium]|nr:hypothetical protein [Thermoanaerobaculia bacterium]
MDEALAVAARVEAEVPGARLVDAQERAVGAGEVGQLDEGAARRAKRRPVSPVTPCPSRSATWTSTGRGAPATCGTPAGSSYLTVQPSARLAAKTASSASHSCEAS